MRLGMPSGRRELRGRPLGTSAVVRSYQPQRGKAAAIRSGVPAGLTQGANEPSGRRMRFWRNARPTERPPPPEMPVTPSASGVGDALVDEHAEQQLDVAVLEALVGDVGPAALAAGGARLRHAARAAEAARGERHHRVALLGVEDVVVVVRAAAVALRRGGLEGLLRARVAVLHHDRGERAVAGRRERDVDVERHAVEARHALAEVGRWGRGARRSAACRDGRTGPRPERWPAAGRMRRRPPL